jgi:mRNA-degrading endonuclease RelE of RelBE toxin-antitoxin system
MSKKSKFSKKIKSALDKFDSKVAEKVLDSIAEEEDEGYELTIEEVKLRERLTKCIEAYERTMYYLEN